MTWRNPHLLADALTLAYTRRIDFAVISDSRGVYQSLGWDHGLTQALIGMGIKIYATGLMSAGEHGSLGSDPVAGGSGVSVGYRAVRSSTADSGRTQIRSNSRAHGFSLRNMESADIANLQADNLAKWDTRTLVNFAPNEPLWFDGIRNLGISSIVGNGTTVTVTTIGNHGLPAGTSSLTLRGTPVTAWNTTFTCTNATSNTFTFSESTVATHNTAGVTYGYAKLASGAVFDGNDALGIVAERGSPLGNDAALTGHVWASRVGAGNIPWIWLANGSSITSGNFAPTTTLARMDAVLTAASTGRLMNSSGIEFRVPSGNVTATGVFWPWLRVSRPGRTAGASVSVLYAAGGQSSYDMALALSTIPDSSMTDVAGTIPELQTGQKILVLWYSGGMNDLGEGSKLAGAPAGAATSKAVIKYNMGVIASEVKAACDAANVRLIFVLVGDYPRGAVDDANEITAATYRAAMDELAQERPSYVCFGDLSTVVSFEELTDTGVSAFSGASYGTAATNGLGSALPQAQPYLACGKTARFTGATTNGTGLLTATLTGPATINPTHIRIESGTNVTPGVYAVASGSGPWQLPDACDSGSGSSVTGCAIDCVHLEENTSFERLAAAALSTAQQEAYAKARLDRPRVRQ